MSKKIGRNESCPCSSGKKYKDCCINKSKQEVYFYAINESTNNLKNDSRRKECMHPDNSKCRGKIIKAHAIQNNRILKKLSTDGMLVTMDGTEFLIFQTSDLKGRKIATTFSGFCQYHDKSTFQDIEDKEFESSNKQIFIFTYRTMAWHYHKKLEQLNAHNIMIHRMQKFGYNFDEDSEVLMLSRSFNLGAQDNECEKDEFDAILLSQNYEEVSHSMWVLPYEVEFTVSMMHELDYDLLGNQINDLLEDDIVKKIYLNIFPDNGKTYLIWSWLNKWDSFYVPFSKQFENLTTEDKKNYLNNMLPRWSDSIVLSPRLWNMWGTEVQDSFISHANFEVLYSTLEDEMNDHAFRYMDTPWDLLIQT